ncbi:hypothetical protein Q3G72_033602 [Acer saccharum]|nr:hypothetical protein Q3G72_033602 [Acer saccharum]
MICDGIDIGYFSNKWIYHGELDSTRTRLNNDQSGQVDDMHGMLHNAFGVVDGSGGEFDGVDLSSPDNDNSGGGDENDNGGDSDDAPSAPSGTEIFQQMSLVKVILGKHSLNTPINKRKRDDVDKEYDVLQLYHQGDLRVNEDLKWLAQGDLYVENESGSSENLQELMDNTYDVRDDLPEIILDSPLNIMEEGDTDDQYGDETDD